ncbi:AAA family ATPase [Candidatus Woesearchaeota archaeon]|nr:AAA family ATPase [Candidatus Woesearchaeota archaeon]
MRKAIIVTGTPGTGKTTVAMRLAKKLGYAYVDVNKVISSQKLSEGYDRKNKCKIIDVKKLSKVLVSLIKKHAKAGEGTVIDSHLSHYVPASAVDLCVVTTCNLKLLKRRLKRRHYSDSKIADNLQAEIFETCLTEARENRHNVLVVETDKKVDYDHAVKKILKRK